MNRSSNGIECQRSKSAPTLNLHGLTESDPAHKVGLRTVAVYEAIKGILVLAVGFGLLALIHRDVEALAERLVRHLRFDPASRYPRIFLAAADRVADSKLWFLSFAAVFYSTLRFIEAYGLWLSRRWAEWFALIYCAIYLPVEIYGLWKGVNWVKLLLFVINAGVVIYLGHALHSSPRTRIKTNNF